jgi:hypothetical protein
MKALRLLERIGAIDLPENVIATVDREEPHAGLSDQQTAESTKNREQKLAEAAEAFFKTMEAQTTGVGKKDKLPNAASYDLPFLLHGSVNFKVEIARRLAEDLRSGARIDSASIIGLLIDQLVREEVDRRLQDVYLDVSQYDR